MTNEESIIESLYERIIKGNNIIDSIQAAYQLADCKDSILAKKKLLDALEITSTQSHSSDEIISSISAEVKITIIDILWHPTFLDDDIIPYIIELTKDNDTEVRKKAVELLGSFKSRESAEALIHSLDDKNSEIRYMAMSALANNATLPNKSSKKLAKFLKSSNFKDRINAIDALGMIGSKDNDIIKMIIAAMDDPVPAVREQTILSIGFYQNEKVIKKLIKIVENEDDPSVQAAAAYQLGNFNASEAVPCLLDLVKNESPDMKTIAIEALSKIKGQKEKSIVYLITNLDHPNSEVRSAAIDALKTYPLEDLIDELIEQIKSDPKINFLTSQLERKRVSINLVSEFDNLKNLIKNLLG